MDPWAAVIIVDDVSGTGTIGLPLNSECAERALVAHCWLGARMSTYLATSGVATYFLKSYFIITVQMLHTFKK